MLAFETFDNLRGRNVAYKALAHPLAADRLARLAASLNRAGRVAIYDPNVLHDAGHGGCILIKDETCRLFGFHGHDDGAGRFPFDHMFGF